MFIVLVRHGEIGNNPSPNKRVNPHEKNYLSKTGICKQKKQQDF